MKLTILLLAFSLAVLSSCTTAYKTGQTPDDVYYSPLRPQEEYVKTKKVEEKKAIRYDDQYYEDRYLRMKVHNRTRWSDLDDWYSTDYRYRSTVYMGCCFCTNSWSPYSHWNQNYNPYYRNYVIIKNVSSPVYSGPRTFNLNTYNANNGNTKTYNNVKNTGSNSSTGVNVYTAPRNSSTNKSNDPGGLLREIFKPSNNSSSSSSNNSNSGSGTTGSSSGSSSSSSPPAQAPVRKF